MSNDNENAFEAWRDDDGNMILAPRDPDVVEAAQDIAQVGGELWSTNQTVARAVASWAEDVQSPYDRRSRNAIFERDKYVTPAKIYEQMQTSYDALDDDIVSNALDVTESLAFNRVRAISDEENEQDLWNQILADLE